MYAGVAGGILLVLLVLLVAAVGWRVSRSKSVHTQGTALGGWNTVANPTYGVHQATVGGGRVVTNAVYGSTPGQAGQPLYAEIPGAAGGSGRRMMGVMSNGAYGSAQATGLTGQPLYAEIPAMNTNANADTNAPLAVAADYYDTPALRVGSSNDTAASASSHDDHDYKGDYAPAVAMGASEWDGFNDVDYDDDGDEEI